MIDKGSDQGGGSLKRAGMRGFEKYQEIGIFDKTSIVSWGAFALQMKPLLSDVKVLQRRAVYKRIRDFVSQTAIKLP